MAVVKLGNKEDFDKCLKDNKIVICDFTASWCGPCKMIGPKFEGFSEEFKNKGIQFIKVDVDENADAAEAEDISAMPTFRVYKDGKKVDELVGASEANLKAMIQKYAS